MIKYSDISVSNISKANFIVNFSNSKNFYEKGYSKKMTGILKLQISLRIVKQFFFIKFESCLFPKTKFIRKI